MKFVTYTDFENEYLGVLKGDKIYSISEDVRFNFVDMVDLIKNITEEDISYLEELEGTLDLEDVNLLSPIVKPIHDIICVGENYVEHVEEIGGKMEEGFVSKYFSKRAIEIEGPDSIVIGHYEYDDAVDYEVELAAIIGKEAFQVKKENAKDYIFGFSVFNDISSRNIQFKHSQWYRGKSPDGYSVMGPVIATVDEFTFPLNLELKTTVNGEVRQHSNTSKMIRSVEEIIEELTEMMTLEPGDIIATGTPSGVGLGMEPKGFLKDDDEVVCSVEGIGDLSVMMVDLRSPDLGE